MTADCGPATALVAASHGRPPYAGGLADIVAADADAPGARAAALAPRGSAPRRSLVGAAGAAVPGAGRGRALRVCADDRRARTAAARRRPARAGRGEVDGTGPRGAGQRLPRLGAADRDAPAVGPAGVRPLEG